MLLMGAMATTRHHFEMIEESHGGHLVAWPHAILHEAPHFVFWALAIPLVYVFVVRLARRGWGWPQALLAHAAFAVGVIVIESVLRAAWIGSTASAALFGAKFLWMLPTQLFTYSAILSGVLAYHYSQRFVEREVAAGELAADLAEARLQTLRAQLRPHFVFNTLNSVAMLVRGGRNTEAVETIARVSDLLREALEDDDRAEVALEEEIGLAQRYLAVEQVRFGDRLRVRVDVTDDAKGIRVPRLVLQPLVENAVRHGIGARAAAGQIEITARSSRDELIVCVHDDGPGPGPRPSEEAPQTGERGLGLKNTRERLHTAYGSAARFTLEQVPGGGALATIVIPLGSSGERA